MPATAMHRYRNCQEWFTPNRYNAWHQHYCSKPSCRVASHCASSVRWRRRNPGYFRGEAHCIRGRFWLARHPGYSRRNTADIQETHHLTHPKERDEMGRGRVTLSRSRGEARDRLRCRLRQPTLR